MSIQPICSLCLVILILGSHLPASAEPGKLPPPSRTVFKCDVAGKIIYSDEPCPGAKRLDIEPSRGLNKSTGREMTGADVARERQREAFAEALRPLTGLTPAQLAVQSRRMQIEPGARSECATLDPQLLVAERDQAITIADNAKIAAQHNLYEMRKRYKQLRC